MIPGFFNIPTGEGMPKKQGIQDTCIFNEWVYSVHLFGTSFDPISGTSAGQDQTEFTGQQIM